MLNITATSLGTADESGGMRLVCNEQTHKDILPVERKEQNPQCTQTVAMISDHR